MLALLKTCEKCHCEPRCLAPDLSGRWGRGNLTKDKNGYTYHYDYENRLIKIKKSNDTVDVAEFTYDALGRRIEKKDSIANKTDRYYYNDNWQVLCDYNDAGVLQRWFAYGNYIDEVLIMNTSTSIIPAKYYVNDHLYSPVALTNYAGTVLERYEYDAYGRVTILDTQYAPRTTSL